VIRLLSLDIAGTTVDEGGTVYRVLRESIETGIDAVVPDDVLSSWSGTSKYEAMRGILAAMGEDEARADVIYPDFERELEAAYAAAPPTLIPGVREACAALRARGVQIALQTGYARDVAESLLDTVGWTVGDDLDALVTSNEVTASRPAPYLVFGTMAATGVRNVAEVLVAGDTANDLLAGTAAGAGYVVGVLTGAHGVAELGRIRHTHLLESVAEIPDLPGAFDA
jgi:phosphonatase-like hydrolase